MHETPVRSLGWEDPLEEGMATHSTVFSWRISWKEEPGGLQSTGLKIVRHDWAINNFTLSHMKGNNDILSDWSNLSENLLQNDNSIFQFSSVTQSCLTLYHPMNRSTPGLPIHHQLLESTQTHVHWVGDAIQPSHPLSSPSPPALNLSQHQALFQWVSSSHQVAKVSEFQLQHPSFQ